MSSHTRHCILIYRGAGGSGRSRKTLVLWVGVSLQVHIFGGMRYSRWASVRRLCFCRAATGQALQDQFAKLVGEALLKLDMTDQKAHQNGPVKRVEDKIEVAAR